MSDHTNKLSYYCSVCQISCTGAPNYQQHMRGKKHQEALKNKALPLQQPAAESTSVQNILASLLANGAAATNAPPPHPERRRERDDPDFNEGPAAKKHKPYIEPTNTATTADVPGDYYCKICDCHCSSLHTWELHVKGRRHVRNAMGLQTSDTAAPSTEQNSAARPVKHSLADLDAAILDFHKRKLVPEPGKCCVTKLCNTLLIRPIHLTAQALALASVVQHVMTALTNLSQQGARDVLAPRDITELKLIGRYAQGTMSRDQLRAVLAVILRESLPPIKSRVDCIAEFVQTHLTTAVNSGALVDVHVTVDQSQLCIHVTANVKQDAALLGAVTGVSSETAVNGTTVHVEVPVTFLKAWSYSESVPVDQGCELAVCRAHLMAIRQHIWFETYLLNNNFFTFAVISPRVLLRTLLHVRDHSPDLRATVTDWTLHVVVYHAVYCRTQPLHDVASVAWALLTVWQYLAAGMLYPINRLMDPCTDPPQLLAAALSRDQQRIVAQSALNVLDLLSADSEDLAAWSQALHGTLEPPATAANNSTK